jgi:hypothetical protein
MVRVYEKNIFTIPLIQHSTRVVHTILYVWQQTFSVLFYYVTLFLARNELYSADTVQCLSQRLFIKSEIEKAECENQNWNRTPHV